MEACGQSAGKAWASWLRRFRALGPGQLTAATGPRRPHPKSGGDAGTCSAPRDEQRSHSRPGSCFGHGPDTCQGPVLWGTEGSWQRLPARCPSWGGAGAGSPGWGGWGQGGGPTPTPEETGPASLPTQRQLSGAWQRPRPERPCRGEAATPPPASQVGLRASRPTPRPTAQRAPGPRGHRLPRRVRARPLPCAWAARTGGWQRGTWPPGLGALGAPSQTLLLPEASAPDLVPRLRCHLLGGVPDPAPDHPRRWPDTLVITRPHYLPPDLGLSGYR